jgi:hypothetical protein
MSKWGACTTCPFKDVGIKVQIKGSVMPRRIPNETTAKDERLSLNVFRKTYDRSRLATHGQLLSPAPVESEITAARRSVSHFPPVIPVLMQLPDYSPLTIAEG